MATFFEGVLELLLELKQMSIKLGVITNGGSAMQRSKIAALGIENLLDAIVISSEVGVRKPDAKIFALALGELNCRAAEAWFVGDHPEQDIRGGEAAGLTTFWVKSGGFSKNNEVPGSHLSALVDLRNYLCNAK